MPDLAERLREFVDTAQPSVTMDEIAQTVSRRHRGGGLVRSVGQRKPLIASLLVAASVIVLIATLLVRMGGSNTAPRLTPSITKLSSASAVLKHAALVADSQQPLVPGPGQFLYVRLLDGGRSGQDFFPINGPGRPLSRYYAQATLEQWTSPSGPDRQASTNVGQPEFITEADRLLWEQAGSPLIETGYSGGGTPPYYDVADLPTDPSKMSAYFASQADLVQVQTSNALPLNSLWDFSTAATFLESGASGPQRAALLEFMATIPGVTNAGPGTTIGTKQSGTIFAMPSTTAGFTFQVIIDLATSEVLEQRLIVSDPSKLFVPTPAQVAAGQEIAPLQVGQAQLYTDFLYAGISNSSSSVPSAAPPSPGPWPLGSGREPLPGSAY